MIYDVQVKPRNSSADRDGIVTLRAVPRQGAILEFNMSPDIAAILGTNLLRRALDVNTSTNLDMVAEVLTAVADVIEKE